MSVSPTTEQLLADAAWLKRLAVTLAGNEDDADDLVQESWVAAWRQQPATDRPLRPWLSKVIRDLAGMKRRSERRRARREEAAHDSREPVLPDALLAQARLHQLIVDLVLKLEEPYRSTVLARFVEGRTAASIARSLGIADSTVRKRLREALARLRGELDAKTGERKAWAPAAIAFARGGMHVAKPTKSIAVLAALLALLIGAVAIVVMVVGRTDQHAVEGRRTPERAGRQIAINDRDQETVAALARGNPPGWIAQEGAQSRRIAGHVLFDGSPAAGVVVRLTSELSRSGLAPTLEQQTSTDGSFDFGVQVPTEYAVGAAATGMLAAIQHIDLRDVRARPPNDALVLSLASCGVGFYGKVLDSSGVPIPHARLLREDVIGAETDASGSYELCARQSGINPGDLRITIRASGFGSISFMVGLPGRIHRDFVLTPEAVLSGHAITSSGEPVASAQIMIESDEPVTRPGSEQMAPTAATTDKDGRFRITGLAAGRHRVSGRGRGLTSIPMTIAVGSGGSKEISVTMTATGIVHGFVVLDGKPIAGAKIAIAGGGSDDAVSQPDGSFVLDRVPVGTVSFTAAPYHVRTPRTLRITNDGENKVTLDVERLGVVSGTVRRHGMPIARARVMAFGINVIAYGKNAYHATYADEAGSFSLEGVEPGDYGVVADSATLGLFVDDLKFSIALGEHRVLDIELASGARIAGVVVDAHDAPVAGAFVAFVRDETHDHSVCVSDASGHFDCASMTGGGSYDAAVFAGEGMTTPFHFVGANPPPVFLADGNTRVDGLRLVIDASRLTIRGNVADSSGIPVSDARVSAFDGPGAGFAPLPTSVTTAAGDFELRELGPGMYSLQVEGADGAKTVATSIDAGAKDVRIILDPPNCSASGSDPSRASVLHVEPTDVSYRPQGRVVWDDRIQLIGWDLPKSVHVGETFEAAIYYRVLQPVGRSWKAFVHIDLPEKGRANSDHDPLGGRCPTSTWKTGDILVDRFTTSVTTNAFGGGALGPGDYDVWIGFFTGWTGEWKNMPISEAPANIRDENHNRVKIAVLPVE